MILTTKPQSGYELLDSGEEMKLERFGDVILSRPDPQALWEKADATLWKKAHARYEREGKSGKWKGDIPKEWDIAFGDLRFRIKPTTFKHTGLFPEQLSNWEWMAERVASAGPRPISVLNLFAYTGGATLALAKAGASVTHVDASKTAVSWARENAELSELSGKPIRWMVEDVLQFVRREIKRGTRYDAILMDPPAFGHGPKDELWKIEEHFLPLLKQCAELLSDTPLFVLINGYASGYSSLSFAHNLASFQERFGGEVEHGELTIEESGEKKRLLPSGIVARWGR